jgi:hypothetical protein
MSDNVYKLRRSGGMSRRRALELAFALAVGGTPRLAMAQQQPEPPPCPPNIGQHNMMVVGVRSVFLSHLPMFVGLCHDRAHFNTEHRFQLILRAAFEEPRTTRDVTEIYKQDRLRHPDIRMYSLEPSEHFALAELFSPPTSAEPRRSFPAQVFQGHLERGGEKIRGLSGITVRIKRVVHAHEFHREDKRAEDLEYILFGTPDELFMAHRILAPGDFDQLLSVRILDQQFSDADLSQGLQITVPGHPNASSGRLRGGQKIPAQLLRTDVQPRNMILQPVRELYFEESELAMPPSFDATREERDAGFER